jgi:hypothetical protein
LGKRAFGDTEATGFEVTVPPKRAFASIFAAKAKHGAAA